MIRGSGPRPDPDSVAFCISISFFMDPDPRIRIRVRVSPNSFRKKFKHDIVERKQDPRLPFDGSVHVFYNLALKKMRYLV